MNITLFGAQPEDRQRLQGLLQRANLTAAVSLGSVFEPAPATDSRLSPGAAQGLDVKPPAGAQLAEPRALLFWEFADPEQASLCVQAVRQDLSFTLFGAILATSSEQSRLIRPSDGFDDFIVCPYSADELRQRLRVVNWRRGGGCALERATADALKVDLSGQEVFVDGRPVPLTAKEFSLLKCLWQHQGNVLTKTELLSQVWGNACSASRTLDTHVSRLRAKLGPRLLLKTVRGSGYKLSCAL